MTQGDLKTLFSHPERPQPSLLSVYLNVDPSRHSNQNRGFEEQLKGMTSSIRVAIHDAAEVERFVVAAHHIEDFVAAYQPAARGLILFFDSVDGFFWHQEVGVPIHNQVRWDFELLLQPLANILDQFERYGVVLVDHARLRLFTVFLAEIEEVTVERLSPDAHLRRIIREVDGFVQNKQAHHLVLAGNPEIAAHLRDRLPKRLASRIIGSVEVAIDAAAQDVLTATLKIAEEYERTTESQTVKEIVRGLARNGKTVAGLGHTLKALNSDRVWELIYSEGLASSGYECLKCAALFSAERQSCTYCGGSVHPVNDVIERAVDHAVREGAKIEVVTGDASITLNNVGGIGAFLKPKIQLKIS
jgi:peptide chain release factor subunit 1